MSEVALAQILLPLMTEAVTKAVVSVGLKELLGRIHGKNDRTKIETRLRKQGKKADDLIVINLRVNPALYALLQKEEYAKYIVIDDGDGIVIVDKELKDLVEGYRSNLSFDELKLTQNILKNLVGKNSGSSLMQALEYSKKQQPGQGIDAQDWTAQIVTAKEKITAKYESVNRCLDDIVECKVKVSDFRETMYEAVSGCRTLLYETASISSKILNTLELKGFAFGSLAAVNASIVFTLYSEAAVILDLVATKWNSNIQSLFYSTAEFQASLMKAKRD